MPPKAKPQPSQSLIVKFKISIEAQTRIFGESLPPKEKFNSTPPSDSPDNGSDANSTPAPGTTPVPSSTAAATLKRKGIPGPKPGTKRGPILGPDGLPKPRGKPGPKKKPRLEDGTIDHGEAGPPNRTTGTATAATHKLGPKANQGAINAGLRALDRSGKPCRKWERKGFQVKSFTGIVWQIPTWRAPKPSKASSHEMSQGNSNASLENADSDSKDNKENSEGSNADADILPSSPAAMATPA